jgi:hypothetical protein
VCTWVRYHRLILTLTSENPLALLLPKPKIFNGRESELAAIVQMFGQEVPRITILGAGGMGKTSLARAVMHHPEMMSRYEDHRLFVPCDTVLTIVQLAALSGAHLGLIPGNDLTRPVLCFYASSPPTLLILDNLGANGVSWRC